MAGKLHSHVPREGRPATGPAHPRGDPQTILDNAGPLAEWNTQHGGLGVDGRTVSRYLDLMVDLLLVRRLRPWRENVGKRLVKSPKIYVRDSGIVHALLGLESKEDILGHPVVGASWEGFVVETLVSVAPAAPPPTSIARLAVPRSTSC